MNPYSPFKSASPAFKTCSYNEYLSFRCAPLVLVMTPETLSITQLILLLAINLDRSLRNQRQIPPVRSVRKATHASIKLGLTPKALLILSIVND